MFLPKNSENYISTSVWSAQHPDAGQNIQEANVGKLVYLGTKKCLFILCDTAAFL